MWRYTIDVAAEMSPRFDDPVFDVPAWRDTFDRIGDLLEREADSPASLHMTDDDREHLREWSVEFRKAARERWDEDALTSLLEDLYDWADAAKIWLGPSPWMA